MGDEHGRARCTGEEGKQPMQEAHQLMARVQQGTRSKQGEVSTRARCVYSDMAKVYTFKHATHVLHWYQR
jgi:hypothetical protein